VSLVRIDATYTTVVQSVLAIGSYCVIATVLVPSALTSVGRV